jgi:hypothetical protein
MRTLTMAVDSSAVTVVRASRAGQERRPIARIRQAALARRTSVTTTGSCGTSP